MVPGIKINELVQRVMSDAKAKLDYIVPTRSMSFEPDAWPLGFGWKNKERAGLNDYVGLNDHALGQMADYVGIPSRYIERLKKDAPDLISTNFNRLLKNKTDDRRMVRTLHGNARAFLSDRYRRLDHEDVAERILPMIGDHGFVVRSANITDNKLYIHVISPKLEGEIRVGDAVRMGWIISNSEIGLGSLSLQLFVERLRCTNGMVLPEFSQRKAHLGGRSTEESFIVSVSDETKKAGDDALWFGVRDHLREFTTIDGMNKVLKIIKEKADDPVTGDPQEVVEALGTRLSLQENERKSVLYSYLEEGDHTRWGLANAITQLANNSENYDRAVMLEQAGGSLLGFNNRDWSLIAGAKAR